MAGYLISPVPGSHRPGTSATWISPMAGPQRRTSSMRFPSPIWAWYRSSISFSAGLPTASTRARVSAALANGVPGGSTAGLRFSRVKTRPRARPGGPPGAGAGRGAVDVEPGAVEPLGRLQGPLGGAQQLLGAVGVGQGAADVPGHRGEGGPGPGPGVEVLGVPVPDLDLEPEVVDPPDA